MAAFKHLDTAALPQNWGADFFGNLVDFKLGKTPPRGNQIYWKEGKYPWVSISDMSPHGIVYETSEFVSQEAYEKVFSGKLIPKGSLLMSFKLTIGRLSVLGIPAFHNEAIISFQPAGDKLDDDFIRYFLSQINYKNYQDTAIKGQTLNKGKLNSLEIPLPPFLEQKKIAHILSTVQRAIEAQERIIQTTTELKKALMQKLFTEGLRNEPKKQTEIGPVPESWEVVRIGDCCDVSTGTTPSTKNPEYYIGKNLFIKTGEITNNRISSASVHISDEAIAKYNLKVYKPGTLLIAMYGQGKTRGQISILEVPASTSQNAGAISSSSEVDSEYLWYYLMSQYEQLRRSGIEGHISHLNLGYVKQILFPKPSLSDQERIASTFRGLDRKILLHQRKQRVFQDLFRTLLHELMTAKIRVHELELADLKY
ncbi:MAG: restriction endonuclease subunit S [Proteobacteria bacterium]|nr:restriction endonuclease subunit S [Pseudomonadota bacterium]